MRKHLARIKKITPNAHEQYVVQAALELGNGDGAAALQQLERAIDAGCERRPLRHRVFDDLKETDGWQSVVDRLKR